MTLRTHHLFGLGLLLTAAAVFHGVWTHRWSAIAGHTAEVDLLRPLEGSIGDWEPGDVLPPPRDVKINSVSRRFVSSHDGRTVVVSHIAGIPGQVATHTPDVCYPGSGFKLKSEIVRESFPLGPGGAKAEFWTADFRKTNSTGSETLRVRWTWTVDGTWCAPDYPRWFFARSPVLHKLYIVHPVSDEEQPDGDPYKDFVVGFLTRVKFPSP